VKDFNLGLQDLSCFRTNEPLGSPNDRSNHLNESYRRLALPKNWDKVYITMKMGQGGLLRFKGNAHGREAGGGSGKKHVKDLLRTRGFMT